MRFEVPQFINVEDKLFGPFTFKQALYIVGGGGFIYIIYKFLPFFVTAILAIPIAAFTLALVFYKPNGRPFIHMVESYLLYAFSQKFYLWRRKDKKNKTLSVEEAMRQSESTQPQSSIKENPSQKIENLAWSLDILDIDAENQEK